jgi:hypothetical protein
MQIIPSKLGVMAQALVAALLTLRSTGEAPAERNAYETFQPRRQRARPKRKKNRESATSLQFAKFYRGRWDEAAQRHVER